MSYYVPWNISYVNAVLAFIKAWIGPIMIIAAICFCTVFGVCLLASIIRKFLRF